MARHGSHTQSWPAGSRPRPLGEVLHSDLLLLLLFANIKAISNTSSCVHFSLYKLFVLSPKLSRVSQKKLAASASPISIISELYQFDHWSGHWSVTTTIPLFGPVASCDGSYWQLGPPGQFWTILGCDPLPFSPEFKMRDIFLWNI